MKLGIFCNRDYRDFSIPRNDFLLTINEAVFRGHDVYFLKTREVNDLRSAPASKLRTEGVKDVYQNGLRGTEQTIDLFDLDTILLRDTEVRGPDLIKKFNPLEESVYFLNNPQESVNAGDKVNHQKYFEGFPTARTYVLRREMTGDEMSKTISAVLAKEEFPLVLKPSNGFAGKGVTRAKSREELESKAKELFDSYGCILVQEFLPEACKGDTRFVFLGGEFLVSFQRVSKGNQWNLASGEEIQIPYVPSEEEIRMGQIIARRSGLDLVSVDKIGLNFSELNASPGFEHDANKVYKGEGLQVQKQIVDFLERSSKAFHQSK
ncbi:hypothetical protein HOD75_05220 [archaeon]|jgi:glutathione synthase/RimK-type ligase-like ATP-grasp enzyme|nr:hypothetical protein [Candidatus Woesearchaeota archaeon]MBT4136131.1 hypothetical protein [archaeon]MBT4242262.1 hypothetical protein [archaeon]MBT4417950.1 hypothetical protein [archaeon]